MTNEDKSASAAALASPERRPAVSARHVALGLALVAAVFTAGSLLGWFTTPDADGNDLTSIVLSAAGGLLTLVFLVIAFVARPAKRD